MLRLLIIILLPLLGLGAGVGAAIMLSPQPAPMEDADGAPSDAPEEKVEEDDPATMFVKLNNQFVIPVLKDGRMAALVVMSLSLEVPDGQSELIYAQEPRLRDSFLQVMFDHANAGGFDGPFTESGRLSALRRALTESAQKEMDDLVKSVLLTEIVRQDT